MPLYFTRCTGCTSIWKKYTIFLYRYKEIAHTSSLERINEQKAWAARESCLSTR